MCFLIKADKQMDVVQVIILIRCIYVDLEILSKT